MKKLDRIILAITVYVGPALILQQMNSGAIGAFLDKHWPIQMSTFVLFAYSWFKTLAWFYRSEYRQGINDEKARRRQI